MRESIEKLNNVDFAQKCLNTVNDQFSRLLATDGPETQGDPFKLVESLEDGANRSPLIGQPVEIVISDPDLQQPCARIARCGIRDEVDDKDDALPGSIYTGMIGSFRVEHGESDTWLNICLLPLGITLPEDADHITYEIPVSAVEAIRFAPGDHPLMSDIQLFDAISTPQESGGMSSGPESLEALGTINQLSRMLGRRLLLAVEHDQLDVEYTDPTQPGQQRAHLPRLAMYEGTLAGFELDNIDSGDDGPDELCAIFTDQGAVHELTSFAVDRIVAGSIVGDRLNENDQELFVKMEQLFSDGVADFLRASPTREQVEEFASNLCKDLFDRLYLITRTILELEIYPEDFFEILRDEPVEDELTTDSESDIEDVPENDRLYVSQWHSLKATLVGLGYRIEADTGQKLTVESLALDLYLDPYDKLARLRGAEFLRLPLDALQSARISAGLELVG